VASWTAAWGGGKAQALTAHPPRSGLGVKKGECDKLRKDLQYLEGGTRGKKGEKSFEVGKVYGTKFVWLKRLKYLMIPTIR